MNIDKQIKQYIEKIIEKHPEFTHQEIQDLCNEYLLKFNKKTKETSKIKSLSKYLSKEFDMDLLSHTKNNSKETNNLEKINNPLKSIPKIFFQSNKKNGNDYILRISKLDKQLGKTILFDDAELNIKEGSKFSLIGKNGSGKSTLLKIIIGKEPLEEGELQIAKGTKIGFLSQDIFRESQNRLLKDEMLTTLPQVTKNMHRLKEIEKLLEQENKKAMELVEEQSELIDRMIKNDGYQSYALQVEILKYFGFTKNQLDYKISQLSGGEQTKIQIAKFLLQEVDLLILDEPTNHLDIEGIMFLENFCELRGKTLICISHDKKFLNKAFSNTLEISNKKLESYEGNYDSFIKQKEKKYELQIKNYTAQQKYLKQQNKFIDRFRYKASKASQVQSRIKLLNKMDKIELPENDTTSRGITFKIGKRLPNLVMKLNQLSVGYEDDTLVSINKDIEITKDMRIGIIGKNGIGKTTLIKTILGELSPVYGGIEIHPDMRIGSYSQVANELDRNSTIIKEVVGPGISQKEARTLLGSLLINEEKMDQKIGTLSGGERAKVALTKMLLSKPHIIIMDEPTNHLDITSKEVIKSMLREFDGVSIIVSHDRDFLEGTSNILWVLMKKQLTVFHNLEKGFKTLEKNYQT
ncbi:MAG TPA: ABC-F family ATP-binding cassette domain-containing protein [Candidatus Absconditabacterales bacterium]|nr:ABC-F family ATP-binding cassette domain-containing protein [Candidatus Absconditabacterales bacterium]